MRKVFLLLICLTLSSVVLAQIVSSSCMGPDSIRQEYKKDADRLAVRWTFDNSSTYKDSVHIDPLLSKRYLDALTAIYNATALPARDTVIKRYKIHRIGEDVNTPYITADSNLNWMKNFKNNIIPVGQPTIDYLMSKYYLKKTGYEVLGYTMSYHIVSLQTDTDCYVGELCALINSVPGAGAGPNQLFLDGNQIEDSLTLNFIDLIFSYRWGDCPSGCEFRRNWRFRVYNNCSVEYLGAYGSPLDFTGIKENEFNNRIEILPNPVRDRLKIQTSKTVKRISLYNSIGSLIYFSEAPIMAEIDVAGFSEGLYYLKLETIDGTCTRKILKE